MSFAALCHTWFWRLCGMSCDTKIFGGKGGAYHLSVHMHISSKLLCRLATKHLWADLMTTFWVGILVVNGLWNQTYTTTWTPWCYPCKFQVFLSVNFCQVLCVRFKEGPNPCWRSSVIAILSGCLLLCTSCQRLSSSELLCDALQWAPAEHPVHVVSKVRMSHDCISANTAYIYSNWSWHNWAWLIWNAFSLLSRLLMCMDISFMWLVL